MISEIQIQTNVQIINCFNLFWETFQFGGAEKIWKYICFFKGDYQVTKLTIDILLTKSIARTSVWQGYTTVPKKGVWKKEKVVIIQQYSTSK
jgi:hypothetical protein